MKHEIEITRVIALLDEVLLVIFEDKTLHVHDVALNEPAILPCIPVIRRNN